MLVAGVVGWTARPGAPAGEPIPLSFGDVTVVDGDTVRVAGVLGGERIRLVGHDAPEVFDADCPQTRRSGAASLRRA